MIDADAVVFGPCPGLVVPEGIVSGAVMHGAEGFCQAEMEEFAEGGAGFRLEEGIVHPFFRIVTIFVFWDDVEIAANGKGDVVFAQGFQAFIQALYPVEFIGEFFGTDGVAVGQVYIDQAYAAGFKFEIAGLFIVFIAGQGVFDHLNRGFGEDGDAVIGFLCDGGSMPAELFKVLMWEVEAFEFLHHQDIQPAACKIVFNMRAASFQRVHIP